MLQKMSVKAGDAPCRSATHTVSSGSESNGTPSAPPARTLSISPLQRDDETAELIVVLHSNRSETLLQLARFAEAAEAARAALQRDPSHSKSKERLKRAKEAFERAQRLAFARRGPQVKLSENGTQRSPRLLTPRAFSLPDPRFQPISFQSC